MDMLTCSSRVEGKWERAVRYVNDVSTYSKPFGGVRYMQLGNRHKKDVLDVE